MTLNHRWVEVTPSQFPHEAEGLHLVKALLPDEPPFRAWSNFEFRDSHGKWHEVDLVVLGRRRMHLIELKYYSGTLRGDDHVWRRDGKPAEDSPLKLARRKAQRLASRLQDELRRLARDSGARIPDERTVTPYVQEAVFLHHPKFTCLLPMASRQDLFGIDGASPTSLLPGIRGRLLEPADSDPRWSIGTNRSEIIATLMKGIGAVQRRQREAGSWIIDEQPLDEGQDWQDWPAFQRVTQDRARIRFFVNPPGTSEVDAGLKRKLAEHEYLIVRTLTHDGVIAPRDIVDTEMGVGLVYPRDERFQRLDLWLADRPDGTSLPTQMAIVRQVAEALGYAHGHRVVHRGLNPSAVYVRERSDGTVQVKVGSWQTAGTAGAATTGGPSPATVVGAESITAMQNAVASAASDVGASPSAFQAPEGVWSPNADRIRLDVFALGALAYYLVAGRPPAPNRTSLRERLSRDGGLDLAADLAQVPSILRNMVLGATRPTVSERTADIGRFLEDLADAERGAALPGLTDDVDPIEATPGTLIGGRFRLDRRLGAGSTAVGLLVTDLEPEDDKADPRRVLKVAIDDVAANRLADEAAVLRGLKSPRIARLIDGPLAVGKRTALLLQFAGAQTLADLLSLRNRLSLDLLERYGTDLLEAVVTLDSGGVDHRDLKPANLGVLEARSGDRAKHLMLFDFSLTRAAASAVDAGTRGYLDPFLGNGKRLTFDSAAERYSAAVVLFEMASGSLPVYGDGASDPVASGGRLVVTESMFDGAVAEVLVSFFGRALNPDADQRHHTAGEMLADWKAVFAPVPHTQADNADDLAGSAAASTPLDRAGLSARALSAIEPLGVRTVGELAALDPVRLNRLPGAADATRREVKSRAKSWRDRLRAARSGGPSLLASGALPAAVAAANLLAAPFKAGRATLRSRAVRGILGLDPGVDAFVAPGELGPTLGASRPRGPQLIEEMQRVWADELTSRALLDAVARLVIDGLVDLGGVAAVEELTDLVQSALPGPIEAAGVHARMCAGLLRVALDRSAALTLAGAVDRPLVPRRRRDGRLSTIATRPDLNVAAEAVGRRADELVAAAAAAGDPLITQRRAAAQLRTIFDERLDPDSQDNTGLDDERLVRLAAALSTNTAVAGDGSLHHQDLLAVDALRIALSGLAPSQKVSAQEIRDRVRARFPALPVLPERSRGLDELIERASLPLIYDEADRLYRSREFHPATTGLETRLPMRLVGPAAPITGGSLGSRLSESIRSRSFLALGVPAGQYQDAVTALRNGYDATVVDATGVLLAAMRRQAAELGLPWDMVTASDAAEAGSRAAEGLASLVTRTVSEVHDAIEAAARRDEGPVLITELAPLARYGHLGELTRWTDLTAPRAAAIWVLVPQLHGATGGLVDGKPLPLGAPGQFLTIHEEWLTTVTAPVATNAGSVPS